MDSFFCVNKTALNERGLIKLSKAQIKGPDLCFLVQPTSMSQTLYYPVSLSFVEKHLNPPNGSWVSQHCECPGNAKDPSCNQRTFFMGLFYDMALGGDALLSNPLNSSMHMVEFALSVQKYSVDDPVNGDLKMQTHFLNFFLSTWENADPAVFPTYPVYNDSFGDPSATVGLPPHANNSDWHKKEWGKLCPWGTCGSFVFYMENDVSYTTTLPIQSNLYQFADFPYNNETYVSANYVNGTASYQSWKQQMCIDTLYNEDMFNAFVNTYPVSFVEPYFICQKTVTYALYNSVGNAAGTAGMVATIAMIVLGAIFRKIQNYRAIQSMKAYVDGTSDGKPVVIDRVMKERVYRKLGDVRDSAIYLLLKDQQRTNKTLVAEIKELRSRLDLLETRGREADQMAPQSSNPLQSISNPLQSLSNPLQSIFAMWEMEQPVNTEKPDARDYDDLMADIVRSVGESGDNPDADTKPIDPDTLMDVVRDCVEFDINHSDAVRPLVGKFL
jgi:hypothetical protein